MITFIWTITDLERTTIDNKVITVHYQVEAVLDQLNGDNQSISVFRYDSISLDGDIAVNYSDLTEAVALSWVKDKLGTNKVNLIQTQLEKQISEYVAPTVSTGVPW